MHYEQGIFYMDGLPHTAKQALTSAEQATEYVVAHGMVPFFTGDVAGLSIEENTYRDDWWCEDAVRDPWEWRKVLANEARVVYGKFFGGKAGFMDIDLFPLLCAYRRDGYDFETLYEMGRISQRERAVMDAIGWEVRHNAEIRKRAGFGKNGYKGYENITVRLQDRTYLIIRKFQQRLNKQGQPYGWSVAHLARPEACFGEDFIKSEYALSREQAKERLMQALIQRNPQASVAALEKMLG